MLAAWDFIYKNAIMNDGERENSLAKLSLCYTDTLSIIHDSSNSVVEFFCFINNTASSQNLSTRWVADADSPTQPLVFSPTATLAHWSAPSEFQKALQGDETSPVRKEWNGPECFIKEKHL